MVARRALNPETLVRIRLPQPWGLPKSKKEAISQDVATTGMEAILKATDTVTALMGKVWDLATSNPLIATVFAVGLIFTGVAVFRAIKRAAR